ncbi:LacI family transcriptional regulator [Flavobacteriaceae bacterium TP-CH-4]|uniref:LacI family transcriptional regulator n=1 Tax=Pelagihabitans pacificus TaxID=2696054 RepID=A0A967AVY8_9FLAO|nr:substrate-binding domain-containing protein [Pelagihabitans pacificus]NHF58587.1 LacI family transcriptional regulator [Pelagihabitans pacificus]
MKKKQVSLKDIAKEVGVSIATVSYVLSKGKDSRVSDAMSEKIREVAKRLNYQPNIIAQSLKSGTTNTIGLILADISNPFFANLARVIEDEAAKYNYTVIFGSSDEKATKSKQLIDFLSSRQVDGFIIAPSEGSEDQIHALQQQGIPVVLIDRFFPNISTDYVIIDNYESSYRVVAELIRSGHRRIGMLAYTDGLYHMQERIRGYQTVLSDNQLVEAPEWLGKISYTNGKKEIEAAIDSMLAGDKPIDSIFFATNTLAIHGLKYLGKLNKKVPDDIAVVSFDEGEAFDFYYCPLTHVRQPLEEMGKAAVQSLSNRIKNPKIPQQAICLSAEVVVRKSSSTTTSK